MSLFDLDSIFGLPKLFGAQVGYASCGSSDASFRGVALYDSITESNAASSRQLRATGSAFKNDTAVTINDEADLKVNADVHDLRMRPMIVFKFGLIQTTDIRFLTILSNSVSNTSANDPGHAVLGIQYDTSVPDTNFFFVTHDGTTFTRVDSGVAADTAVHYVSIDIRSTTSVIIKIYDANFVEQASHTFTSGLPISTEGLLPWIGLRNLVASVKSWDTYFFAGMNRV